MLLIRASLVFLLLLLIVLILCVALLLFFASKNRHAATKVEDADDADDAEKKIPPIPMISEKPVSSASEKIAERYLRLFEVVTPAVQVLSGIQRYYLKTVTEEQGQQLLRTSFLGQFEPKVKQMGFSLQHDRFADLRVNESNTEGSVPQRQTRMRQISQYICQNSAPILYQIREQAQNRFDKREFEHAVDQLKEVYRYMQLTFIFYEELLPGSDEAAEFQMVPRYEVAYPALYMEGKVLQPYSGAKYSGNGGE